MSDDIDRLPPPAFPPGSSLRMGAGEALGFTSEVASVAPIQASAARPDLEETARILEGLALELREVGVTDFLTLSPPTNFEAVLRGYIAGYFSEY